MQQTANARALVLLSSRVRPSVTRHAELIRMWDGVVLDQHRLYQIRNTRVSHAHCAAG